MTITGAFALLLTALGYEVTMLQATLQSDDLILEAYRRLFGIHLDRVPVVQEPDT